MGLMLTLLIYLYVVKGSFFNILPEHSFIILFLFNTMQQEKPITLIFCCTASMQISPMMLQINMIFLTPSFLFSFL